MHLALVDWEPLPSSASDPQHVLPVEHDDGQYGEIGTSFNTLLPTRTLKRLPTPIGRVDLMEDNMNRDPMTKHLNTHIRHVG